MPDLYSASGLLVRDDDLGRPVFAGTCFAFRRAGFLLTAAHCLKEIPPDRLSVAAYQDGRVERGLRVHSVHPHPSADVAVVVIHDYLEAFAPFSDVNPNLGPGEDVAAFGFPEDSLRHAIEPIPRLFRGFVQRLFEHESEFGYNYIAAELGFGAPAGLSGGPLIISRNHLEVAGVVTENTQASTYVHTLTEVREAGREYVERVHSTITYGIAVDLGPLREWLDHVVPPITEA